MEVNWKWTYTLNVKVKELEERKHWIDTERSAKQPPCPWYPHYVGVQYKKKVLCFWWQHSSLWHGDFPAGSILGGSSVTTWAAFVPCVWNLLSSCSSWPLVPYRCRTGKDHLTTLNSLKKWHLLFLRHLAEPPAFTEAGEGGWYVTNLDVPQRNSFSCMLGGINLFGVNYYESSFLGSVLLCHWLFLPSQASRFILI